VVFDLSPGGSGVNLSGDDRPGLAIMSAIIETVATALAARPDEADWTDLTLFLATTPPG
jgi:hypothetical protein